MKIVYLVNQYPAVTHTFIRREMLALEQAGVEIIRAAIRPWAGLVDASDIEEQRKTIYLMQNRWRLIQGVIEALFRSPAGLLRAIRTVIGLMRRSDRSAIRHCVSLMQACVLTRVLKQNRARHMHAHFGTNPAEVALLASEICGATFSFTVHGYDEYDKPEFLALALKIRRASFVAAVSQYGCAQLLRWCDKGDKAKIHLVRCGLQSSYGKPALEAAQQPPRLVCIGRLCREKAQDVLLRAAARLKQMGSRFELVLVGDGETRRELEGMIHELGLSSAVRMTGWLSGQQVQAEISGSHALVVASLAENLPVVIMEAMALGRPVVATWIAGIPELVIPGQTGWLVPASCADAMAQALHDCLAASAEHRQALGQRGRQLVLTRHDSRTEAAKLVRLFQQPA